MSSRKCTERLFQRRGPAAAKLLSPFNVLCVRVTAHDLSVITAYLHNDKRTEKMSAEWSFVPVIAVDDVKDDEDGRVDDAKDGEARYRDKQRQRSSEHIVGSVIARPAARHPELYHCQSPHTLWPPTDWTEVNSSGISINRVNFSSYHYTLPWRRLIVAANYGLFRLTGRFCRQQHVCHMSHLHAHVNHCHFRLTIIITHVNGYSRRIIPFISVQGLNIGLKKTKFLGFKKP